MIAPPLSFTTLRQRLLASDAARSFLRAAQQADGPALLIVNDPHRATQTRPMLDALVALAKSTGDAGPRWNVLIATGTHRFSAAARQAFERATFADAALRIERIDWHDALDATSLGPLDSWHFNRALLAARHVLAIGSAEPHYFAGLTGAHKTLTIGAAAHADIVANHADALAAASAPLALRGNPVFDGIVRMLAAVERGRNVLAINEVVVGDEIVDIAAGGALETLTTLVPTVRSVYVRSVRRPVDLLHLRVPPPLDVSFYQADKAIKNSGELVRAGGGIILEAACPEGIGNDAFLNLLRRAETYADALAVVRRDGYRFGDHKAVKLRRLTDPAARGVRLALVTRSLTNAEAGLIGARAFDDVTAALAWLADDMDLPPERGVRIEDAALLVAEPEVD